ELDPLPPVQLGEREERAVQIDRLIPSREAEEGDHPLALPERIDSDEMRAIREQSDRFEEAPDLLVGGRMTEDREPERRFGDEQIERETGGLERGAGRIRGALEVSADERALSLVLEQDLRAPEDVARRKERHPDAA